MNYPAQLEFYNLDDVYVTSRDINLPSFNYSAPQHILPGYWDSERLTPSNQPDLLRQGVNVSR